MRYINSLYITLHVLRVVVMVGTALMQFVVTVLIFVHCLCDRAIKKHLSRTTGSSEGNRSDLRFSHLLTW